MGLVGLEVGWTGAAAVVLLASMPGLVPPPHNWIYRVDRAGLVLALGVVACLIGLVTYAGGGSGGLLRGRGSQST